MPKNISLPTYCVCPKTHTILHKPLPMLFGMGFLFLIGEYMRDRKVLLLNASEEILKIIDWKRAVVLQLRGKAVAPFRKVKTYTIKGKDGDYDLPHVLMLTRYVHVPYKENIPSRLNIFARDKWTCQYCGKGTKNKSSLTIDHVMPKSRGGDSSWTNLTTACARCNTLKANKTPKECRMNLHKKPYKPTPLQVHFSRATSVILDSWTPWLKKVC